jgi:hypothetical protein
MFALVFVTAIIAPQLAPARAEALADCHNAPPWNFNTGYFVGSLAQLSGRGYRARYANLGQSPDSNSGINQAWEALGECMPWGPWLDHDDPTGNRDDETLTSLVSEHRTCAHPVAAECRRKSDAQESASTGEISTCSASAGFECINAKQPDGICDDYEVRFYCPGNASDWINRDTPANGGDFETRESHFQQGLTCEYPVAAECKRMTPVSSSADREDIVCNPAVGLMCRASDQADDACDDYAIRYFCAQ